jgi:cyclopropane fatty-acyl-phospholipid synthase-like methyltransferase
MSDRTSEHLVQLIKTALGYCPAQVLFTAHRLGVFTYLAGGGSTVEKIAAHCRCSPRHMEYLLNACVPLGLVRKHDRRYDNTALASAFLVESAPQYMGEWLNLWAIWYDSWGNLEKTVRLGRPSEQYSRHLGEDVHYTRNFILAMHQYARGPGKEMVNHVDLSQRKRLIDVGGGPGTYSVLLAEKNPQLHAVVFDLPPVVEIARDVIEEHGVSDRVTVRAGDYSREAFGSGDYDVVLLSNMLHQEDPEMCRSILRKAYDALQCGGLLIVQAMFLNGTKDGPLWPALHSLLLTLIYQGGRAYSADETLEFIAQAGFVDARPKRLSLLNAESLILATKA